MRVEGFLPTPPGTVRHAPERAPQDGFAVRLATLASPARHALSAISAPPVGGMLAVQVLAAAGEGRRRAIRRGTALLETLDELQAAILDDGTAPERIAARLAAQLSKREPVEDDPDLAAILDAIELRAQVEIAKVERDAETAASATAPGV